MDPAVILTVRDENLTHARASLESLHRTLPPRWRGTVTVLDRTAAGDLPPLPRPVWRVLRADCNAAVSETASLVLCFLEAGTILLPGWLAPMTRLLSGNRQAGCIGNIQREPYSGLLAHVGIGFGADGLPGALGADSAFLPRMRFDRHAAVSMACCLMKRDVFVELGGFDAAFHGPIASVDFCLHAAQAGYRHYVANRSVVYSYDTAGSVGEDPDFPLYQQRWGRRAAVCYARRAQLRSAHLDQPCSPEQWELARETRRVQLIDANEIRRTGVRYLTKHWFRPWRYNADRISRALGQVRTPSPPPLPRAPTIPRDVARADDGWLFDPPPQP